MKNEFSSNNLDASGLSHQTRQAMLQLQHFIESNRDYSDNIIKIESECQHMEMEYNRSKEELEQLTKIVNDLTQQKNNVENEIHLLKLDNNNFENLLQSLKG